jgi:hypothetical protein
MLEADYCSECSGDEVLTFGGLVTFD